jgi:hypothetical protein
MDHSWLIQILLEIRITAERWCGNPGQSCGRMPPFSFCISQSVIVVLATKSEESAAMLFHKSMKARLA